MRTFAKVLNLDSIQHFSTAGSLNENVQFSGIEVSPAPAQADLNVTAHMRAVLGDKLLGVAHD